MTVEPIIDEQAIRDAFDPKYALSWLEGVGWTRQSGQTRSGLVCALLNEWQADAVLLSLIPINPNDSPSAPAVEPVPLGRLSARSALWLRRVSESLEAGAPSIEAAVWMTAAEVAPAEQRPPGCVRELREEAAWLEQLRTLAALRGVQPPGCLTRDEGWELPLLASG